MNDSELRDWLFHDEEDGSDCRGVWVALAKEKLIECKPKRGGGIWNGSRSDWEDGVRDAIHREIFYTFNDFGKDSEISEEQLALFASEIVADAIKEIPWWTDSDALFAETGLRYVEVKPYGESCE